MSLRPASRLFVSAAERSGDTHAASVVRELKQLRPDMECAGFGGDLLATQGCHIHEDLVAVSTMGFGFLRHMGRYLRVFRKFYRCLVERTPSAVLLVDSPGFNFFLARLARWRKVPVIYYICPQIWAWAPWRRSKVLRYTDLLLVILPFEEELYRNPSVPVKFVGHPLADSLGRIPASVGLELRRRLRIPPEDKVIGILPGSREQEVTRLMPILREIINGMDLDPRRHRLLISSFREGFRGNIEQLLWGCRVPHEILLEDSRAITAASDLVLVASGTASLEVAYFEKPMLVLYGVSRFTRFGYDLLAVTPYFSLPNILGARLFGGEPLVLERLCLGAEATELALAAKSLLDPGPARQQALDRLREFKARTFRGGASRRAAEAIVEFLESRRL